MPPTVLIAANPYEGELCRKALAEIGLELELVDSTESALKAIAETRPLAVIIADGWYDGNARELLVEVRSNDHRLPIFLVEDRASDIVDEEAAIRRGATRLFLRPIEAEALAGAVEKLAVEAEYRAEQDAPEIKAELELEALSDEEWDEAPGLPRVNTEVLGSRDPAASPKSPELSSLAAARDELGGHLREELTPTSASMPIARIATNPSLLRADDALADAAGLQMSQLADSPSDLIVQVTDVPLPRAVERTPSPPQADPRADRSSIARRLDRELSELERRLFPEAAPQQRYDDDDEPLGDIDLDSFGVETIPGIALDSLEPAPERERRPRNGNGEIEVLPRDSTSPLYRLAERGPPVAPSPPIAVAANASFDRASGGASAPAVDERGSLAVEDVAEMLARLHAAGFTGRVRFTRGDQEKRLYFDEGVPVYATSTFANDRLGDLLWREGKLTREQMQKTRELTIEPGRKTAQALVELGLLKPNELYPSLRRSVEEIFWSVFGWDDGTWALSPEQAPPEDRVRPSAHPWALILEGVRRKYSLERLIERVGPPETVLTPTLSFERAMRECGLSKAESAAADLFDGERSITDVAQAMAGAAIAEAGVYALAWGLRAIGGLGEGPVGDLAVRAAQTVVSGPSASPSDDRRSGRRGADGPADRAVDRDRLLAKQAQIADCDYFSVLGVDRQASTHEIERAWERLRIDFSPDRFPVEVRDEMAAAIAEIRDILDEAHRILGDESLRRSYREHLVD